MAKEKFNNYIHINDYIHRLRIDYPLEIELREFSQEEFKKLQKLSKHIRNFPHFKTYLILDEAIAHHIGGLEWQEDQWIMEAILYNLNRLLKEKGPYPTDDDLKDYIESHTQDLKWNLEVVKKLSQI